MMAVHPHNLSSPLLSPPPSPPSLEKSPQQWLASLLTCPRPTAAAAAADTGAGNRTRPMMQHQSRSFYDLSIKSLLLWVMGFFRCNRQQEDVNTSVGLMSLQPAQ